MAEYPTLYDYPIDIINDSVQNDYILGYVMDGGKKLRLQTFMKTATLSRNQRCRDLGPAATTINGKGTEERRSGGDRDRDINNNNKVGVARGRFYYI
jgi:hypothetical protein